MKLPFLLCALCASPVQSLSGAERVVPSHVGLSAQLVASKSAGTDHFKTDYGSSDIHTERSRVVEGAVRNFGAQPVEIVATIRWIGKKTYYNTRFLLRKQTETRTIQAGQTATFRGESGAVKSTDLKLVAIHVREVSGARIEGWVIEVREKTGNALVAIKGSDSHLEEMVLSGAALPAE